MARVEVTERRGTRAFALVLKASLELVSLGTTRSADQGPYGLVLLIECGRTDPDLALFGASLQRAHAQDLALGAQDDAGPDWAGRADNLKSV